MNGSARWGAIAAATLAMGCGDAAQSDDSQGVVLGQSGLPLVMYMDELSEAHRRTFCGWQAELYGGPGSSVPCGTGRFELPPVAECAKSSTAFLHVTVETTEECVFELMEQGDVCTLPESEACAAVAAAREQQPPSNGTCTADRWSGTSCETPDFF